MDFLHHRKLLSESFISTFCEPICNITAYCEPACLTYCPTNCSCTNKCLSVMFYDNPAPSPPIYQEDSQKSNRAPKLLVTSIAVLCAVFLVVCFSAMYYRFYGNRRTQQQSNQNSDDFLDEDNRGPILDHPIWYIRTTGLQPSIISSITVLKYKKEEGILDGTDCSVCLTEFQEDETVRLLPKCSHAFHVSCIDTWLRSHTNCPLCRAPIVTRTIRTTPFQTSVVNSGSVEESQVEFADNTAESNNREIDQGASELRVIEEEGATTVQRGMNIGIEVRPRRSVSLDSSSAAKINIDLRNGSHLEKDENFNGTEEGNAPTSSGSSHWFAGKARLTGISTMSKTSSNRPGSMRRSFSWSGIILSSRHIRSQKTKATVRSF